MALQIILCMEANKQAATDFVYIKDTINRFYICNNKIKISSLYMNGKSRYNNNSLKRKIDKLSKDYYIGNTKVIYCIDTDLYEIDVNHSKEFDEIYKYCNDNNYDMIWFCHDVEEVYVGKRVSDNQKVNEASIFRKKNLIQIIKEESLMSKSVRKNHSNILLVLDKYMCRK